MIYSKYLFKKTAISFAGILTILILLIWFSRAIPFVRYITENGVELSYFFFLFILILPWLLLIIIPISLLIANITIFNRLINSNEITILKNSGLTNLQIAKPLIIFSAILSLICFCISIYFMPLANKELRLSRNNIRSNYASLAFNSQTFESLKDITIYTKTRNQNNELSGILLHDKRSDNEAITITAKKGKIIIRDSNAFLYMEEGSLQRLIYNEMRSDILYFDSYIFNLSGRDENQASIRWKAQERYINELLNYEDNSSESDIKKYIAEFHERLTQPFLPLIFTLIASASMMSGQFSRHGNIKNIVRTIILCSLLMATTIVTYSLIESSTKYIYAPYINYLIFMIFSVKILATTNKSH